MNPGSEGSPGRVSDKLDSSSMAAEFVDGAVVEKHHYEEEIESLVKFFGEDKGSQLVIRYRKDSSTGGSNIQRKKIATFLEGSPLPFSALVKDIFEKLSGENDQEQSKSGAVTLASVRSIVLSLGERISFGITNPDTDVLEDDTVGSLWRWEVRDVRLLSKGSREEILDQRRWRKKTAERIAALSAILQAFSATGAAGEIDQVAYFNAKEALAKTDDESAIRAAKTAWQQKKGRVISAQGHPNIVQKHPLGEQFNNLSQELGSKKRRGDPDEKERLRQEKLLKRQEVENEKEKRKKDREEADRKKQQQRQQDRQEKEDVERKRQEKKQHDEAEKQQKLEAGRKKQLALKKQASFMDRFLVKKDQANCVQSQQAQAAFPADESQNQKSSSLIMQSVETAAVVARMDMELSRGDGPDVKELWLSNINNWRVLRNQCLYRKAQSWGVRRKPKVSVYTELRLQGTVGDSRGSSQDDGHVRKIAEHSSPASHIKRAREEFDCCEDFDWKENVTDCYPNFPLEEAKKSCSGRFHHLRNKKRKLLQFDKSHRPPYYGTFSKRSEYIRPRRPLNQDPSLQYDVDSDEEWEEEDPGESLSDVDKDEDEEKVDIEDDEDSADEFVVPDGYLSEDEGVAMEDSERGPGAGSSTHQSPTLAHHNVMSPERLRKILDNATEHAIRTNHPLVVSNLGQIPRCEEDPSSSRFSSNRTEVLCLEALRIRVLVPNLLIGAC